ncbi:hypothetical protein AXF42_Ash009686 [Apostasia shenzhenica]|uniref:Uncharacterized protein n=1 Tax=Apostasia shenzhenica TaxID=1088818 RepID=A0A2I0AWT4_9ASPA|nr:hypothetical protein AXF42_Ash009686 [Apostasia shenzhenica]
MQGVAVLDDEILVERQQVARLDPTLHAYGIASCWEGNSFIKAFGGGSGEYSVKTDNWVAMSSKDKPSSLTNNGWSLWWTKLCNISLLRKIKIHLQRKTHEVIQTTVQLARKGILVATPWSSLVKVTFAILRHQDLFMCAIKFGLCYGSIAIDVQCAFGIFSRSNSKYMEECSF